jgi:Co/Zn/Cd efflux system component
MLYFEKRQKDVMHNHSHESSDHLENEDVKNIGTAFFLNLFFTIVEFAGGTITNSVAILSDAVHDLGDCISLGMSWVFSAYLKRAGNKVYTYGYKRFLAIGSIITSVVLAIAQHSYHCQSRSSIVSSRAARCTRNVAACSIGGDY